MEKIRKGNDIEIKWAIYAGKGINEVPYDLSGRRLNLYLNNQFGKTEVFNFKTENHILSFTFFGKDQEFDGIYHIELVENEGRKGMHTVDECKAFTLVNHTCDTGGEPEKRMKCIHLEFRSMMSVDSSSGASIDIDNELSRTSENPVQNKVVTKAIDTVYDQVGAISAKMNKMINDIEKATIQPLYE